MRLSGPVKEHQWSPADNYVAAYIPENSNIPAKIVVVEIPSQKVIAQTTLFNVTGVLPPFLPPNTTMASIIFCYPSLLGNGCY